MPAPGAPWIGTIGVGVTVVTPLPPTVGPPAGPISSSVSAAVWLQSSISRIRPAEVIFCWSTRHCACGSTLPNEPPKYRLDALALEDLQGLVVRLADDVRSLRPLGWDMAMPAPISAAEPTATSPPLSTTSFFT